MKSMKKMCAGNVLMTQNHFMILSEQMNRWAAVLVCPSFDLKKKKKHLNNAIRLLFVLIYQMDSCRSMDGLADFFHVTNNGNSIRFCFVIVKG